MGTHTDAIIFFGYCWKEENQGGIFKDWKERIAQERGHANPWEQFPNDDIKKLPYMEQRAAGDNWTTEHSYDLDKWHDLKRKIAQEFAVEADNHCSGDFPIPYLYAKRFFASREYPEHVDDVEIDPTWAPKLDALFAALKIEKPHAEPRWWLVSYWG